MSAASQALQWVLGGAFAVLGLLTGAEWMRHRDRVRRFLALSIAMLSLVAVLGAVASTHFNPRGSLSDTTEVLFLVSGWSFLMFRDTLLPLPRAIRWAAGIATALVAVLLLVAYVPGQNTMLSPLQSIAAVLLLVVWAACVGEPVARFWVMAGHLPSLQRARLRALVTAYAGIVLILALSVVAGVAPQSSASMRIVVTPLTLLIIPLFYAAFAPPGWVRRFWREREEQPFRLALNDLLVFAPDRKMLAQRALSWACRLVGAGAAMIATADGQIMVTTGLAEDATWDVAGQGAAPERHGKRGAPHNVIEVPLQSQYTSGVLAVRAGPLTPLFGDEEVQRLRDYANALVTGLDRVYLVERLQRSAELMDLAYNPIFSWSAKTGAITYWNTASEALYGWKRGEAIGAAPTELLKSQLPKPRDEVVHDMRRERLWEGEIEQVTRDGRRLTVNSRWALQLDDNGEPDVIIEVNRDVTDERRHALELSRARDAAEQASAAKSEYLSRMSHELRTPLTAILGYSDLLELREPREDQLEALDAIQQASSHLLSLVNDVLDIARIEAGREQIDADAVSLQDAVRECLRLIGPSARDRAVQLSTDLGEAADATVQADRQRLLQVLLNLVSNAVKYSGEGALVTVAAQPVGDRLRIAVRDTGPGITPELQGRLFQPFERLGAERTGTPGTGLGLALAKRLTEAMGGVIGVESAPGRGSTFWIELQRAAFDMPSQQRTAASAALPVAAAEQRTVLYVEDNLGTIKLMEEIFRMRPSVQMITAMQGRMALELAREHQPDLVILDLHLPDMTGDDVLRQLRGDPQTSAIPVVMFSADATERQVKRLMSLGARAYLAKPAKVNDFLTMLDQMLTSPRSAAAV